jgi:nucleotide-binding universal stress UspA family protein
MMFQRILVPTDFSEHADRATRIGADLSRRYEVQMALLYVHEPVTYELPDGYVENMPSHLDRIYDELNVRLAEVGRVATSLGACRLETRILQGSVAQEIAKFASERDLIVMGTHGRQGLQKLLVGSIAQSVLQRAPCPVLVARAESVDAE